MTHLLLNLRKSGAFLVAALLISSGCVTTKGLKGSASVEQKEDALALFKQGAELLYVDNNQALELFDRAQSLDNSLIAAHYNAGVALEALFRPEEAAKRYEACLAVNKTSGSCLINLLLVKAKNNDLAGAIKLSDQYIADYPDELFAKVARAKLWFFEKNYVEAEKLAREVIERDAENVEALFIMAQIFNEQKQYGASKWVLKNALEVAPSHGAMYLTLGQVDTKLELLHDALDSYELAVKYQPTEEALESYGLLLLKRGRDRDGLDTFKKLSELSPNNYRNYLHLGNAYMANRDFLNSKAAYLRAYELSQDKDVLFNLGMLHFELKPESLPELERLKLAQSYFKSYLEQELAQERVAEVNGYLKIIADRIEILEYVPEPEPEPEAEPEVGKEEQEKTLDIEPAVKEEEQHEHEEHKPSEKNKKPVSPGKDNFLKDL